MEDPEFIDIEATVPKDTPPVPMTKPEAYYTEEELAIFVESLDTPGGAVDQPYEVGRLLATISERDARIEGLQARTEAAEAKVAELENELDDCDLLVSNLRAAQAAIDGET